jgi:hypothetical protein
MTPGHFTSIGTRKPPSKVVPFSPLNGVLPPSGHEKASAPLSLVNITMVLLAIPRSSIFLRIAPTSASNFHHPVGEKTVATLTLPFGREVGPNMHARRVIPKEKRLARLDRTIHEVERATDEFVVRILHAELGVWVHVRVWRKWTSVRNRLLANPAPSWILGRVIYFAGLAIHDISRAELGPERRSLRIIILVRLLHGVEMIEDAIKLVEAVNRRQEFIAVSQMVLANLRRGVTVWFEKFGNRRVFILQAFFGPGQSNLQ